ncbi:MAG TPA: hypothetical protein VFZ27_11955 [Terriglobia bacterium]|nr:hypothetical protein [Terriglobia bacterium]
MPDNSALSLLLQLKPGTRTPSENGAHVEVEEESRQIMVRPAEVEAAKAQMMNARKALEDYENLNGHGSCTEHMKLVQAFANSAKVYLRVSISEND